MPGRIFNPEMLTFHFLAETVTGTEFIFIIYSGLRDIKDTIYVGNLSK